jgi:hypothetical protein
LSTLPERHQRDSTLLVTNAQKSLANESSLLIIT